MLTKEDVDSWNKLFPDCQLNKTNLSNPSEQFLTQALVVYLRRFGFRIEPPFNLNAENKENNKETRLFLIKLSRQIDHFLKITDNSYNFTYFDLIRPTPRKTAHMLYILLNYFYYYNLYKEDVFKMAGDRIRKLDELKGLIEVTRRDNNNRIEECKNLKAVVTNLTSEVPAERTKLKELDKRRNEQEEEFQKLNQSYQELREKLQHLDEQKKLMRKRIVPNDEAQELKNQLQQLKLDLSKLKEVESNNVTNLNGCKESNAKLQNLSKEVENAYEIIPLSLIEQLRETTTHLSKAKKDEHDLKIRHEGIIQEIEEEKQKRHSLEDEQQNKNQEFEKKQKELIKTLNENQKSVTQKSSEISQLEEEDHLAECELENNNDISQYLAKNLSEILAAYEN